MLDDVDRRILRIWQDDPELAVRDLGEMVGISAAKVGRRLDRMFDLGVIKSRRAMIDWPRLGYEVAVSLRITLDKTQEHAFEDAITAAQKIPEVVEIQTFLGRVDLRLSVIARDMAHYQQIWRGQLLALPHIADIEGLMTISRVKDERRLPL